MVAISARNTIIDEICKLCKAIFSAHFSTKFWDFTTFKRFFPGIWFFCLDKKFVYKGNWVYKGVEQKRYMYKFAWTRCLGYCDGSIPLKCL